MQRNAAACEVDWGIGFASNGIVRWDDWYLLVCEAQASCSNALFLTPLRTQGNYDSVSSALPSSVNPVTLTNSTEISQGVLDGTLIAGYLSEGANPDGDVQSFNVFPR